MRLMLIEDDAGTREALAAVLRRGGFEIAAAHPSAEAALQAFERAPIDVAVVDLGLPGLSGAAAIHALRARRADLPILVLSVFEDPALIVASLRAGASGYMLKDASRQQLCQAVREVADGLSPLSPAVARHLVSQVRREDAPGPEGTADEGALSAREREVLALLAEGRSYESVAVALDVELGTVQTHVKRIYKKLQVSSKTEAARVAVRRGILPRP